MYIPKNDLETSEFELNIENLLENFKIVFQGNCRLKMQHFFENWLEDFKIQNSLSALLLLKLQHFLHQIYLKSQNSTLKLCFTWNFKFALQRYFWLKLKNFSTLSLTLKSYKKTLNLLFSTILTKKGKNFQNTHQKRFSNLEKSNFLPFWFYGERKITFDNLAKIPV